MAPISAAISDRFPISTCSRITLGKLGNFLDGYKTAQNDYPLKGST
jgi:hypothetical protein